VRQHEQGKENNAEEEINLFPKTRQQESDGGEQKTPAERKEQGDFIQQRGDAELAVNNSKTAIKKKIDEKT
jgi:hypothetical protein